MANNFDKNVTKQVMDEALKGFDELSVITKNVNTKKLDGVFGKKTGDTIDFPRPSDHTTHRTDDGDVSALPKSDIIHGNASGRIQQMITSFVDFRVIDQAIKMRTLDSEVRSMTKRIVHDLEVDFASFAMKNCALKYGTPGTPADSWGDVAGAGAMLASTGVTSGDKCYFVNPFTQRKLADGNKGLGAGGAAGGHIKKAVDKAMIDRDHAGMSVYTTSSLSSYTTGSGADRSGTIVTANPDSTYLAAKDTMTQSIQVTGFEANLVVSAGEVLTIAARNRLNLANRKVIFDDAGSNIVFSGTVVSDVTLGGSGEGTIVITGPAIFESTGAYNTVDSAPQIGDVVTLGGSQNTSIQPNLFWEKDAFGIGFVDIERLYSTDTFATTSQGITMRVSKGSSLLANKQIVRIDLWPAFACFDPFKAGHGYGV